MTMEFLSMQRVLVKYNKATQVDETDQYPPMVEFEYLFVIEVTLINGKKNHLKNNRWRQSNLRVVLNNVFESDHYRSISHRQRQLSSMN